MNLPNEIKLDILKCCDFYQLNNIAQTNHQFSSLINRYINELAREKYNTLSIDYDNGSCSPIRLSYQIKLSCECYNFEPSKELENKWNEAIKNQIPMGFFLNEHTSIYLYIIGRKTRRIELPLYPSSIEEMLYIRHCFQFLSTCAFEQVISERVIINPKLIKLLFDDQPLQINCNYFNLLLNNIEFDNHALEFAKSNLIIHKSMSLRFIWAAFTSLIDINKYIFLNFLLNAGANIPFVTIVYIGSALELHNFVIEHAETSPNCLNMVKSIEFQNLKWKMPKFSSNVKLSSQLNYILNGQKHHLLKYEMSNIHNSNVNFFINIWKQVDSEIILRFKIQQIN